MYREKIEELKKWKESKRRKPLIIRGARQVGKTWLMKEFGSKYYEKCAYINFDDNETIERIFEGDLNTDRIIEELTIETGIKIEPENTLIIFDEIQETPKALKALKYFCENARDYHIISAGSLLGVAMHSGTSFPVGKVEYLDLAPLSYFEFLEAMGEKELLKILKNNDFKKIHVFELKFKQLLKTYFYVGGMPEVVSAFIENRDWEEVRIIQKTILDNYEQDFSKHAPNNIVPRIRQLWNNIPTQLAKENKKFIYGLVSNGARAREYELALSWLIDCGLIYQIGRVQTAKIPLSAYQDFSAFKLYLLDVGLLSAMAGIDAKTLLEGNKVFTEFKGSITEQFVLCQLKQCTNLNVFYWSADKGVAELDFITQIESNIVPIEVKAEENLQAKSLKSFVQKYDTKMNVRTSMSDYRKEEWLTNIPLYCIGNIVEILKSNQ